MTREGGIATWLTSRWFIVPAVFTAVTLGWLAYVSAHDNGLIDGRVVDAKGDPVAGATVQLFERGFVTHEQRGRAVTDAEGRFRFTDNRSHSIQLEAEAPGLGRTDRRILRLWFAAQDAVLPEPLRFPTAP
ncbi:MAG: carboxypeptidase regulatory-like domain-containing protein [Betaproteobacteria bacterium]|nr:carboxypeptidase regulatory-like domain-containing protein [Betaproteobacteria bacterium]MBK7794159.1 carboxypeptidase regulatory-like domain-containing protein [Betaproteobacteria bacterium]